MSWLSVVGTVAVVLATASAPCAGAPQAPGLDTSVPAAGLAAPDPPTRPSRPKQSDSAWPTFQVIDVNGELAVVDAAQLLTASVFLGSGPFFVSLHATGLAIDSARTAFISGNDDSNNSALGRLNFNTGALTTVGSMPGYLINDIAFDDADHLYGLTDNARGISPHSLVLIDTVTATPTVLKVLDNHGGTRDSALFGAITFNSTDGSFYYADLDSKGRLFLDKLAPGTLAQTPVLAPTGGGNATSPAPQAMAFSQGKLWLFLSSSEVLEWDPADPIAGLWVAGNPTFPSPNGGSTFYAVGAVPNTLSCIPSANAACLYNRFKIEVTYDSPGITGGSANVVLESTESVKFSFFEPTNIELILKILNACAFDDKWWVFAGGLTNLAVTVKVTDTANNQVRTYHSAKGLLFQPFADTSAFGCP